MLHNFKIDTSFISFTTYDLMTPNEHHFSWNLRQKNSLSMFV